MATDGGHARRRTPRGLTALAVGVLTLAALPGCDDEGVHAYRVPKTAPPEAARPASAPTPEPASRVVWDEPEGWTRDPTPRQFRVATFQSAGGVEISVSAFAGAAGGLLANVNRWRGQVGLDPIGADRLDEELTPAPGDERVRVLDLAGSQRMVVAHAEPGDGQSWFVKATGEPDAIEGVKPEMIAFAASLRLEAGAPAPAPAPVPAEGSALPFGSWQAPASWQPEPGSSGMVAAAWTTASGCRVTVSRLRTDGGGLLSNVNMWRAQLALDPVAAPEDAGVTALPGEAALFDGVSPDGAHRVLVARVPEGGRTWYVKATGPAGAVEGEAGHVRALIDAVVGGVGSP